MKGLPPLTGYNSAWVNAARLFKNGGPGKEVVAWENVFLACRGQQIGTTIQWARHLLKTLNRMPSLTFNSPHDEDVTAWLWETAHPTYPGLADALTVFAQIYGETLEDIPQTNSTLHRWIMALHCALLWRHYHFPIFKVTRDLLSGLLMTSMKDVPADVFKMPFPVFMCDWPFGAIDALGAPPYVLYMHQCGPNGYEYGINSQARKLRFEISHKGLLAGPPAWYAAANEANAFTENLRRMVVGICLFVIERGKGEHKPIVTKKKRRKKGKLRPAQFNPKPSEEYWELGKEITLDAHLTEMVEEGITGNGRLNPKWSLKKRSSVIGHWRNQACGPGYSERKLVWIQPYWKGPKEGVKVSHIYTDEKRQS